MDDTSEFYSKLDEIDQIIQARQEFSALKQFMDGFDGHHIYPDEMLTDVQRESLQDMVNRLGVVVCEKICQIENLSSFELLSRSIALLQKQDMERPSYMDRSRRNISGTFSRSDYLSENTMMLKRVMELEKKTHSMKSNIEAGLLNRIAKSLNIDGIVGEMHLIKAIQSKIQKRNDAISDVISAFGLPAETRKSSLVTALRIKLGDLGVLSENSASDADMTKKIIELANKAGAAESKLKKANAKSETKDKVISGLREQVTNLEAQLMEEAQANRPGQAEMEARVEIKRLENEMKKLEIENEQTLKENDELSRKYSKAKKKVHHLLAELEELKEKEVPRSPVKQVSSSIKERSAALDVHPDIALCNSLSEQLEKQMNELSTSYEQRMQLVQAVQKMSAVNQELEKQLEFARVEIDEYKLRAQEKGMKVQVGCDVDERFIEAIVKRNESTKNSMQEKVDEICHNEEQSAHDRALCVVDELISAVNKCDKRTEKYEALKDENRRVMQTLGCLTRFLKDVADNRRLQDWLVPSEPYNEVKSFITAQVDALQDYAKLGEQECLFTEFLNGTSQQQLSRLAKKCLETCAGTRTINENRMFSLLVQVITAAVMMNRYTIQAREQATKMSNELSRTNQKTSELYDQVNELTEALDIANERAEKATTDSESKMKIVRQILQNAADEGKDGNVITRCLEELADEAIGDEETYIQNLQRKIEEAKEEIESERIKHNDEVSSLEGQITSLHSVIEKNEAEKNKMETEIEELKKVKDAMRAEKDRANKLEVQLNSERETAQATIEEAKMEHEMALMKINEQLNASERKVIELSADNAGLTSLMKEIREKAIKRMTKQASKLEKEKESEKRRMEAKIAEITHSNRTLEAEKKQLLSELQVSKAEYSDLKKKAAAMLSRNKELEKKSIEMQVENRITKSKLMTATEQAKREKSSFDTQMRLKSFVVESDARSKIDSCKVEAQRHVASLMSTISCIFSDFVTPEMSTDSNAILDILMKASQELQQNRVDIAKLSEADAQNDRIRKVLGLQKHENVTAVVAKLATSNTELLTELQTKEAKLAELELEVHKLNSDNDEWDQWARTICTKSGACSETASVASVRKQIENRLGNQVSEGEENKITLAHVVSVVRAVLRLQRNSRHPAVFLNIQKPMFSARKFTDEKPVPVSPIFRKFVVIDENLSHNE